jgi:hypothetical protein
MHLLVAGHDAGSQAAHALAGQAAQVLEPIVVLGQALVHLMQQVPHTLLQLLPLARKCRTESHVERPSDQPHSGSGEETKTARPSH